MHLYGLERIGLLINKQSLSPLDFHFDCVKFLSPLANRKRLQLKDNSHSKHPSGLPDLPAAQVGVVLQPAWAWRNPFLREATMHCSITPKNRHWTLAALLVLLTYPPVFATVPTTVNIDPFFSQSAEAQQESIWKAVEESAYTVLPEQDQAPPNDLALLSRSDELVKVFQYSSIVMPKGRLKGTHQFGTVAKVEFEAQADRGAYTGLFRSGGLGILRLSLAKANPAAGGSLAYIPNLSLKLLRDASPDTNILAMHSIEGLGKNPNFLSHSFSNFPGPGISVSLRFFSGWLEHALGEYTQDYSHLHERAQVIPLAESSFMERDGVQVPAPHAPYEVIFMPNPKLYVHFQERIRALSSDQEQETMKALDFRRLFAEEPFDAGEVLFEVYARDRKEARQLWDHHWGGWLTQLQAWWKGDGYYQDENPWAAPAQSTRVGRVVLKSRFIASRFGDQLPFRHPTLHEVVSTATPSAPTKTGSL